MPVSAEGSSEGSLSYQEIIKATVLNIRVIFKMNMLVVSVHWKLY